MWHHVEQGCPNVFQWRPDEEKFRRSGPQATCKNNKLQRINYSASSRRQASTSTTPPPTNFKGFSTPTRINRIPATEREYTGSLVSVPKSTSGRNDRISESQWDWKNTEHDWRGDFEKSSIVKHSHIKDLRTTKSTGRQSNSSHLSTHGTPDASGRPSWYLATPTTDRRIFNI